METISIPRLDCLPDGVPEKVSAVKAMLRLQGVEADVACANWGDAFPSETLTKVNMAHNGRTLWLHFKVEQSRCLRAVNTENQSPVSQDSCVEFFVQPRKGGEYWNFEFNCIGAVNASHRLVRPQPVRLSADELDAIYRCASLGSRPFGEREGSFSWDLLIGIPLALIGLNGVEEGTAVRGNFYSCASAIKEPYYLSWAPIETGKPDYHRPEFFGELIFE